MLLPPDRNARFANLVSLNLVTVGKRPVKMHRNTARYRNLTLWERIFRCSSRTLPTSSTQAGRFRY